MRAGRISHALVLPTDADRFLFEVDGPVRPMARARAVRTRRGVRHYTPEASARYKESVAWHARQALGHRSWKKAGRFAVSIRVTRRELRRGDIDNIAKVVLDALTGTAYADDRQVMLLTVQCFDSTTYEGLLVVVRRLLEET